MSPALEGVRPTLPDPERFSVAPQAPEPTRSPSEFTRVLNGIGTAIDRGERIMAGAASGTYASLDAGALIALQAGIYRYSEAIDLTSKLVDRVTNAARTVLQAGH
jgi:hypothetical protein